MSDDRILIVDDDKNMLEVLSLRLEAEGYNVCAATSSAEALGHVKGTLFDLALVDLRLGEDESGIDLMKQLHQVSPEMPVIILTAHGTIDTAVEAMKLGAYSFLTKPFNRRELLLQIKNGLEKSSLSREVRRLKSLVEERYGTDNIIGKSKKMHDVMELVARAAETDSNVCICGESGTGKELIAKSLHLLSARKDNTFVAVNCAAIPEGLLEGEMFGHEKGAFTGAIRARKGFFEQADKGTLFLDEVSEMPETMQVKLLRVLQERCFSPLGKEAPISVDTRIITATNRNLEEEVKNGRFRRDLFYRIYVIPINLPPLRERREDIPLLAGHFLDKFSEKMKKDKKRISASAMQKLIAYAWPGNVRELENVIEYAVAMCVKDVIEDDLIFQTSSSHAGETGAGDSVELMPFKEAKEQFERNYIAGLLSRAQGNISRAAKMAGKYRGDIYSLLKKHALDPTLFKKEG
ncbi:MAG: sigma-54-dependent Fis family transcriptional regulator [Deltaproteobacteria bacterium]|nr:sigma-54-dependent Fis family transcriptional regulator [Deltaproteobacteria bacterium]